MCVFAICFSVGDERVWFITLLTIGRRGSGLDRCCCVSIEGMG